MFVFRKIWRALFSWKTHFLEIRPFALLPTNLQISFRTHLEEIKDLDIKVTYLKSVKDVPKAQRASIRHSGRLWQAALIPYKISRSLGKVILFLNLPNPWTQDLNWMYIRRSEDMSRTSSERLMYFQTLFPRGKRFSPNFTSYFKRI